MTPHDNVRIFLGANSEELNYSELFPNFTRAATKLSNEIILTFYFLIDSIIRMI